MISKEYGLGFRWEVGALERLLLLAGLEAVGWGFGGRAFWRPEVSGQEVCEPGGQETGQKTLERSG